MAVVVVAVAVVIVVAVGKIIGKVIGSTSTSTSTSTARTAAAADEHQYWVVEQSHVPDGFDASSKKLTDYDAAYAHKSIWEHTESGYAALWWIYGFGIS